MFFRQFSLPLVLYRHISVLSPELSKDLMPRIRNSYVGDEGKRRLRCRGSLPPVLSLKQDPPHPLPAPRKKVRDFFLDNGQRTHWPPEYPSREDCPEFTWFRKTEAEEGMKKQSLTRRLFFILCFPSLTRAQSGYIHTQTLWGGGVAGRWREGEKCECRHEGVTSAWRLGEIKVEAVLRKKKSRHPRDKYQETRSSSAAIQTCYFLY